MADISSSLRAWSATASSNAPAGTTAIGVNLDDNLREIQAVVRGFLAGARADKASASTVDLSTVTTNYVNITGTTTITSFGTESAGIPVLLRFDGALTLTHNATSLILPGGANITTKAGDIALVVSEGSGNWRVLYSSSSGLSSFLQSGTGASTRDVQAKLRDVVSVKDFGAVGDGATDDATAFANAIATGKTVYVPKGTYAIASSLSITNPVAIVGEGVSATVIERNYSPVNAWDGVFSFTDGGTESALRDMTIRSKTGQTGGCLVSIKPTSSGTLGLYRFDNVDFTTTGTDTHNYTIYTDGTAKTSAPIGIRGLDMVGCSVFGAATRCMLIKGVLKFSFVGGGVYAAGGTAATGVEFTGDATVKTQAFRFEPADCTATLHFDYCQTGVVDLGTSGAITNTSNASYIQGKGYATSVQNNWSTSTFILSGGTLNHSGNIVATNGSVYGTTQSGSSTAIASAGGASSTSCGNGLTFTFTTPSAKPFHIATGGGAAALVFADYKSTTITLLANPSSEFEASSTPTAGKTGIFKSANSHVISVKNGTGSTVVYTTGVLNTVSATTDPA